MNEAEMIGSVVLVLVIIVGLFFTIYTPMKQNVKAMTELTCTMKLLSDKLTALESNNTDSHRRIWDKEDEQDEKLSDHEKRISIMEKIKGGV